MVQLAVAGDHVRLVNGVRAREAGELPASFAHQHRRRAHVVRADVEVDHGVHFPQQELAVAVEVREAAAGVDAPAQLGRQVQSARGALVRDSLKALSPGGVLYFSTNFRKFSLRFDAKTERASIKNISAQTIPEDFRNQWIHTCYEIKHAV